MPIHTVESGDQREERQALLMRATNDGIWDWDLQTNQVYFSPRWKEMLGFADNEIGNTFDEWRRLIHPDDVGRALALIQNYLAGQTADYELEHRLQHKDGTFRWVLARGMALRTESGHAYRMVGSHADITERKRAEEALRASETNMRSLLENAQGFGIYRLAMDPTNPFLARVVLASPSLSQLLGASDLHDFTTWFSKIHPEDLSRVVEANRRSLLEGVPFDQTFRCTVTREDGPKWIHVRSRPILDNQGGPVFFNGLVVDMTEQKSTEEALRRSEARFRSIFEQAPVGIVVTDERGHRVNRAAQEIIGYTEEELAQMIPPEYIHPDDVGLDQRLHAESEAGMSDRYQIEKRYVHRDGRIVWSRYTHTILREGQQQPLLHFAMLEDITEQRKAEAELRRAYGSLERRVQERTRELTALNAIAAVVSQSLQLKEIMRSALDKTMQVTGMEIGATYRLEMGAHTGQAMLRLVGHQGLSDELAHAADCFPLQNSAVEHAALLGQPYVWRSEDLSSAAGLYSAFKRVGLKLAITIPLMVKGDLVGGMSIGTRQANSVASELLAMLAAIGQQIGLAIENARLYESERERHQEAERRRLVAEGMREIIAVLNSKQTLHDILDLIVTQACRVLASDAAIIFRLQAKDGPLVIQSTFGLPDSHLGDLRFSIREGATWKALLERRPQFISDAAGARSSIIEQQMPANPERAWAMRMFDTFPGVLAAPLIVKGEDYGVLTLFYRTPRGFSDEEISLASAVANQAALAIENARLHEQAQQLATTAERGRLARELHDSVTQSLYTVMLYAETAVRSLADGEIAEAGDFLKELRDTAQDALREMRLLIFELRPPTLEKDGLLGALRTRLNAVEGRGGMKADLQVNDDRIAEQLPFSLQEALYHIVQEALNNVIRHAHAKSVRVLLKFCENAIQLQVSDDGIGFDLENVTASSGLGLSGMRERVQRIGGTVEITSAPGKGTLVMVSVLNAMGHEGTLRGKE